MKGFNQQDDLGRTLSAGIHGTPELRPDEKRRYLGFFRERVIQAVTYDQIRTKEGLGVMLEALKDKRGIELVIHQDARGAAMPLIVQAKRQGLDFTIVSNPNFIGEVAVVLVAKDAVDVAQVWAERS
ncbi:MAG: YueI family protein [Firmicutes bacterium]|nr:YueI family protein [Bacillota bacterium]